MSCQIRDHRGQKPPVNLNNVKPKTMNFRGRKTPWNRRVDLKSFTGEILRVHICDHRDWKIPMSPLDIKSEPMNFFSLDRKTRWFGNMPISTTNKIRFCAVRLVKNMYCHNWFLQRCRIASDRVFFSRSRFTINRMKLIELIFSLFADIYWTQKKFLL